MTLCPIIFNWYNLKNVFSLALDFDSIDFDLRFESFRLRFNTWNQAEADASRADGYAYASNRYGASHGRDGQW